MSAEKFTINSVVVYTVKSKHGDIEIKGYEKLKQHGDDVLGAFVDGLHSNHTGNLFRDKQRTFDYIAEHRQDLETIFAMQDAIADLSPVAMRKRIIADHCDCCDCREN